MIGSHRDSHKSQIHDSSHFGYFDIARVLRGTCIC
jgi:hypothetical protein